MRKFLTQLFCFTPITLLFAQGPNVQWSNTYGGSNIEKAYSVTTAYDGGSVFIGTANSNNGDVAGFHGSYQEDIWVVKLDSSGNIQWNKCLGGTGTENAYKIIQVADGGYMIVGLSDSIDGDVTVNHSTPGYLYNDVWIVKLDSSGNLLWEKSFGCRDPEYSPYISEATDGGIFVCIGLVNPMYFYCNGVPVTYGVGSNTGSMDYWVIKLNSTGEVIWNGNYGGENSDRPHAVKATPDGGCIVVGQSNSHHYDVTNSLTPDGVLISDYWVLKLSSTGAIQWQNSYGGLSEDWATSISLANDGGYVVAGNTRSNNTANITNFHGSIDGWVIKLSATGVLEWQKCIGGSGTDYLNSVITTVDGGFVVCGQTDSVDGDLNGITSGDKSWIFKLSMSGDIIWQLHFKNMASFNTFNDIVQFLDRTYLAVGSGKYLGLENQDVFAVKLEADLLSNSEFDKNNVVLYPNAVSDILNIQVNGHTVKEINIYNILGTKLDSFTQITINLQSLQKGVYFVEVIDENNLIVRKKIVKN